MNTPDAQLNVHRIPRQVVVEQDACELKVDPLAPSRRADEDARPVGAAESALCRELRVPPGVLIVASERIQMALITDLAWGASSLVSRRASRLRWAISRSRS
jgi:hypothetical protein